MGFEETRALFLSPSSPFVPRRTVCFGMAPGGDGSSKGGGTLERLALFMNMQGLAVAFNAGGLKRTLFDEILPIVVKRYDSFALVGLPVYDPSGTFDLSHRCTHCVLLSGGVLEALLQHGWGAGPYLVEGSQVVMTPLRLSFTSKFARKGA